MKKNKKNVMNKLMKEVKNKFRPVETGKVWYKINKISILANIRSSYKERTNKIKYRCKFLRRVRSTYTIISKKVWSKHFFNNY